MFNSKEALYSLNALINDLDAWGWADKAETLRTVRDSVWADSEDSTPERIFTGVTYLPAVTEFPKED